MDSLCIVIPAYNEEETILRVLDDWYPVVDSLDCARILIIDDGSTDETAALVRDYAGSHPYVSIKTKPNGGHGAAIRYGYQCAVDEGYDWIFQTDSDGQTLSSEFGAFWRARRRADLVIGWRRDRQDGAGRVFVSFVLRLVVFLTMGVSLKDPNTPFRLMSAGSLKKLLPLVPETCDLTNVLLAALYIKKGLRVLYKPVTFRPRQGGVNSINIKRIVRIGLKAVREFRKYGRVR